MKTLKKILKFFLCLTAIIVSLVANGQWTNDPSINTAICIQNSNQNSNYCVSDNLSGTYIIWVDNRAGNEDIYAQRVDVDGFTQWTNNGIPVCNATASQNSFQAISDGYGNLIVAWKDYRNGHAQLFIQKINPQGNAFWQTDGVLIDSQTSCLGGQLDFSLAADGLGGAVVVYIDCRTYSDVSDLYSQRIDATGNLVYQAGGVVVCNSNSNQDQSYTIYDNNGGCVVVWRDTRNWGSGNISDIYAQRLDVASGNSLWTANGVPVCVIGKDQIHHNCILSPLDNSVIVIWGDSRVSDSQRDIYAQKILISNGLAQWTANGVPVCTAVNGQDYPFAVYDNSGGAYIVWTDWRNDPTSYIYIQRLNTTGSAQWTANGVQVCVYSASNGRITNDNASGAIICWADGRNGNSDVFAQRFSPTGSALWSINGVAVSSASGDQYGSKIIGINGNAVISWDDNRNGNNDIYCQKIMNDGLLPIIVPSTPGLPTGPTNLCQNSPNSTYTISPVLNATAYSWQINPSGAGTIAGTGTTTLIDWDDTFSGVVTVTVKACNNSGCSNSSNGLMVNIDVPPTIVDVIEESRCGPGSVVLGAISSTGTINWYATATGGSSLWAGTSFTTPSITSTTTYYVDAQQGTCVTPFRTAVIATIITPPSITNTTPGSRCGPGSVVLGATSSSGTINWYTVPTGGTLLGNGGNYSTPSISLTTTYYTDATLNSCTTATRTSVVATINTQPAITVQPVSPAAICTGNGIASFSVTATGTQLSYQWQESTNGGISFTNITGCTGIYSGCTTNSLTITNPISGMNGYKYRCVVSGLCSPAAITNGNAMLSVNACQVAPITYAGKVCGAIGNTIIIPVTVLNFSGIAGISLTLHYNAQVLSWISAQNINPSLPAFDINIGAGGPGEIVLSWFGNATTLTNGSSLCELKFTYLGGITNLTWYDNGNSCEYADEIGNAILDTPYESYYKSGHVEQSPCANTAVENTVVGNGVIRCFDATQTITVAGNGTIFTVYSGGQATMIAGQKISYLPGTTVYNGGYLWGYIAPLGPFCASSNMPTFPSTTGIIKSNEENLTNSKKQLFTIYPNPTNGNFILELSGEIPADKMIVDIYGMWGKKVLSEVLQGEKKYEFSLSGRPTGVYFIRIISGISAETMKIIKE